MALRKFRSVEEMKGPEPLRPLDPENLRAACELTGIAWGLHPWRFTPGVRKFRSMEEANQARAEWERAQVRKRGDAGEGRI